MTTPVQLPKVAQARIARLARSLGRSPAATLRFVLRDGFDAVEQSARENAIADAQFGMGASAAHDSVMQAGLEVIQRSKHVRAAA